MKPITEFIILVGAPMTGKTLNKVELMRHFHCEEGYDLPAEEAPVRDSKARRILILTCDEDVADPRGPYPRRRPRLEGTRISVATAAVALGDKWIHPLPGWKPEESCKTHVFLAAAQSHERLFFSHDPSGAFRFHATPEEAMSAFKDAYHAAQEALSDGSSEDNEQEICWGQVCQHVVVNDRPLTEEEKAECPPEFEFIRELTIADAPFTGSQIPITG